MSLTAYAFFVMAALSAIAYVVLEYVAAMAPAGAL